MKKIIVFIICFFGFMSLTGCKNEQKFIISFDSNGGSLIEDVLVESNSLLEEPTNPILDGSTFDGWYQDEEFTIIWNFEFDRVSSNMILYAKWKINSYEIKFDYLDENITYSTVSHGDKIIEPEVESKAGYIFAGWYKDNNYNEIWNFDEDVVTDDLTLYIKWEKAETYVKMLSQNEYVYIYGYIGMEDFDLATIDSSLITTNELTYEVLNNNVIINDQMLTFVNEGTDTIIASDGESSFKIKVLIGKDKESMYDLSNLFEIEDYILLSGDESNVSVENDTITLTSSSVSKKTRLIYKLEDGFDKDYTFEATAKFTADALYNRVIGLVFRTSDDKDSYPYRVFGIQKVASKTNGVQVYEGYSLTNTVIYNGTFDLALKVDEEVNLKVAVSGNVAKCYINGVLACETFISSSDAGYIGFQVAGATVQFSNIKLSVSGENEEFSTTKISSNASTSDSRVVALTGLKPSIIGSFVDVSSLDALGEHANQYYIKIVENNGSLDVYSYLDEKMEYSLNKYLYSYKGVKIPNIEVSTIEEVALLKKYLEADGIIDLTIWSSEPTVLKYAHEIMNYVRTGYIWNYTDDIDVNAVNEICNKAGSGYASLVLVDNSVLTKENVTWFTARGYSVVADSASNYQIGDVIDGALDGCSLILTSYTEEVKKEIDLLYDDSVFYAKEGTYLSNTELSLFFKPLATGHRGSGPVSVDLNGNPMVENTLESMDWAFAYGADALEIDIHMTLDNQIVICHDSTTGAIATEDLTIKNSTLEQLQALTLVSSTNTVNSHIPTLIEVFERYGNEEYKEKTLVIEVKDGSIETAKAAIELSKLYGWYGRFIMISFSLDVCKAVVEYDSSVKIGYLGGVSRGTIEEYWDTVDSYLNDISLSSAQHTIKSDNIIYMSNSRGQIYWLWTFNEGLSASMLSYINNGNKCYTTDYIEGFSYNQYKLTTEKLTYELNVGDSMMMSANAINYLGQEEEVDDLDIIVISGNAVVDGNKITRTGEGKILICLKYRTKWTVSTAEAYYHIYSDLITIN